MKILSCGVHPRFTDDLQPVLVICVNTSLKDFAIPVEYSVRGQPGAWKLWLLVIVAGLSQFLIALAGKPDLMGNEHRLGAYALNALRDGQWFIQRDFSGDVASKPPMLTWLVTLGTFGSKDITRFALYWPTAAATIGVALVLLTWGRRYFGWQTGLLSALAYLFSWTGQGQMFSARYDGLLALAVTLAALAAFRSWTLGKSWDWFWLAVAFGTMIKGPLALLLGAAGLMAVVWEKFTGNVTMLKGSHWLGVLMFLLICGGWFALAYLDMGQPLIDKMLGRELVGHLTGQEKEGGMLAGFYKSPTTFLASFAPWSLLACVGFWRVWRHPAAATEERRLERLLTCWFFLGLIVFCVAAHQRGRLIQPLIPAAALIAGRELARWLRSWPVWNISLGFSAAMLILIFSYHHGWAASGHRVQETVAMRDLADVVRKTFGEQFPLVHVAESKSDTSFALQFYLNTATPLTSMARAGDLLKGDYPAVVAVMGQDEWFHAHTGLNLHEIARWPQTGKPAIRIVGNCPPSELSSRLATIRGPLFIRMDHAKLIKAQGQEFTFSTTAEAGRVSVLNQSREPQSVRIQLLKEDHTRDGSAAQRVLSPGEEWTFAPAPDEPAHSGH